MKILIDARFYGLENAGIGRWVMKFLENLQEQDKKNQYVILLREKYFKTLTLSSNFTKVLVEIPHYSLEEQLRLPGLIRKQAPDFCHFPHFNVPIFYQGKFVVTIHDLIKHTSRGPATTTRQPLFYFLKYAGYKIIFNQAIKNSQKIIVPSRQVKEDLVEMYQVPEEKIAAVYEGVEEQFTKEKINPKILKKYKISKPFIIYTGSVYPHKNIKRLLCAIKLLNRDYFRDSKKVTLVISCARNVFWERLKKETKKEDVGEDVNLAGFIPDEDLRSIYSEASCFVFPTLSEGFGLPGLEAMSAGLPVVCSDIPVLREIYGEAALFFDPQSPKEMAKKILKVMVSKKLREQQVKKGLEKSRQYSWAKMSQQILEIYQKI